jgi:hypothetical protein
LLTVGSAAAADQELADASTEASPSIAAPVAASSPEAIPRSITAAAPEKQAVTATTTASTTSSMSKTSSLSEELLRSIDTDLPSFSTQESTAASKTASAAPRTASLPEELLRSIGSGVPSPTATAQEKQAETGTSATPHVASGVTEAATALPATTAAPESVTFPFGHEEFPLILDMSREEQLPISEVDSNIWQITTTYDPPDENAPAGISSYLFRDVDGGAAFAVSEVVDGDVPDMRQGSLFSAVHVGGTEKHYEASSRSTAPTVAMAVDPTVGPVQVGHVLYPVEVTSMAAEAPDKSSVSSDPETAFQGKRNYLQPMLCTAVL